jgi:hypothetical protein
MGNEVMKLLAVVFLIALVIAVDSPAFAASYDVKIRQINIEDEGKSAKCSDDRECAVPLMLRGPVRNEPVMALVKFKDDRVVSFKFQNFRGYLYAGPRGGDKSSELNGLLDESGSMNTNVTLYYLSAPVRYKTYQLPVVHGEYAAIGDIEISIAPR